MPLPREGFLGCPGRKPERIPENILQIVKMFLITARRLKMQSVANGNHPLRVA
jgi:hypothetical protein